ncbi:hypothetical protein [Evansella tamaricis]|uniref:Uncharacterized protein n=1 Tax=Evansella tamaricis TaxID=2069301 RepID=A0ABS6JAH2_9BACI|nr:hypothetical protein [Evansella tamaricis]MBU9710683.1 hypothetical protein [Evansella tamaricis]
MTEKVVGVTHSLDQKSEMVEGLTKNGIAQKDLTVITKGDEHAERFIKMMLC